MKQKNSELKGYSSRNGRTLFGDVTSRFITFDRNAGAAIMVWLIAPN